MEKLRTVYRMKGTEEKEEVQADDEYQHSLRIKLISKLERLQESLEGTVR